MTYTVRELPGGIRVIHCPSSSRVSHLGIYLNAGSRDEQLHEQGIAHFIEHMAFKGTTHRKAYHVLNRLDSVGGDLNAYTTKEHTCLYASFLKGHEHRAIELFADIIMHSVFPEKEIEKEKTIILDEINTYLDSPSESIFDDFEEILFPNHPLGRNILGTPESVKRIHKNQIVRFIRRNYNTHEMVITYAGSTHFNTIIKNLSRYFDRMPWQSQPRTRTPFTPTSPTKNIVEKQTHQTHAITGTWAYPNGHPQATTLHLLNNIIGGPGSNSRLNMALRERRGYTYHIESNYQTFSDTGYFSIYMGTTMDDPMPAIALVNKELAPFTRDRMGPLQLHRAKRQLAGQLALMYDVKLSEMLSAGKRLLNNMPMESPDTLIAKIEKITADQILETAREILVPDSFSTLIYPAGNHEEI
jgi:predicted Zn-dependent peptidase